MTLKSRISLSAMFLVLLTLSGALGCFYFFEQLVLTERILKDVSRSHRKAVLVAEEALLASNDVLFINYAQTWLATPGALEMALLDADGNVYLHSNMVKGDISSVGKPFSDEKWAADSLKSADEIQRVSRDKSRLDLAAPVHGPRGTRFGTLSGSYDFGVLTKERDEALKAMSQRLLLVGAGALVLGFLGALWLASGIARPLERIEAGVRRWAEGDFSRPVEVKRQDEIGRLAHEFNEMSRRLKELLDLKDRLFTTLSHDMRAPLTVLGNRLANLELVFKRAQLDGAGEDLDEMKKALDDMGRFVDDILDLAQSQAGMSLALQPLLLPPYLQDVAARFRRDAQSYHLVLDVDCPPDIRPVRADPEAMGRVIANLLLNAFKFTPDGGRVVLGARGGQESVQIFVSDTGPGIAAEDVRFLFTPFHRARSGTVPAHSMPSSGLGLAISKGIVTSHGGEIWVESAPGGGAQICFTLPYMEAAVV
jgi:signal transduction histidine kinase